MKKIISFIILLIFINIYSQHGNLNLQEIQQTIIPLRTYDRIPKDQGYYLKDTNNELPAYEGTWTGTWNGKTVYITFKKITNKYDNVLKYNKDLLIARFKTLDSNGNVLFDNTSLSDDDARITGGKFRKLDDKYSMLYYDTSLCNLNGYVYINFTDNTKTKLEWKFAQNMYTIFPSCFFYDYPSSQAPKPLPENAILTKQ